MAAPVDVPPTPSDASTTARPARAGTAVDRGTEDLQRLYQSLLDLRQDVQAQGERIVQRWRPYISQRSFMPSARNLAYYLALRRYDLRALQETLAPWGVSSLGRCESHVLATLDAVIATMGALAGARDRRAPARPGMSAFTRGHTVLKRNTEALFGSATFQHRDIRIMATLPTEAASDSHFMRDLIQAGVDCVRINCAHDTREIWAAMIANVHTAESAIGRRIRIAMDLGGPKPRLLDVHLPQPDARIHLNEELRLVRSRCQNDGEYGGGTQEFRACCSIPQALDRVQVGESVWIDDGKIGSVVATILPDGLVLRITHARAKGERLAADKGLNFPDSALDLSPLTEKDWDDLDFVTRHADIINYSFVQKGSDMDLLLAGIHERLEPGRALPGIIAKIETKRAVHNLPDLIAHTAGRVPFGVMIARGDLAVEVGFERLAEIQEEMLWLCEAAHVPVIWATQVLETLIKKGMPSRAEITDAAMSERAECVMLNKGPYLPLAVATLHDVLLRMQAHQSKKTARLRALHMWQDLCDAEPVPEHRGSAAPRSVVPGSLQTPRGWR